MIRALMIVEAMANDEKKVKEHLSKHVMILDQIKDLEVHSIKISEAKEMTNNKGMYTCFAECDFTSPNYERLSETMFDFMPSSIEILEPTKITLDLQQASSILNQLSGRLHRYQELMHIAEYKIQQYKQATTNNNNNTKTEKTEKKKTKNKKTKTTEK